MHNVSERKKLLSRANESLSLVSRYLQTTPNTAHSSLLQLYVHEEEGRVTGKRNISTSPKALHLNNRGGLDAALKELI